MNVIASLECGKALQMGFGVQSTKLLRQIMAQILKGKEQKVLFQKSTNLKKAISIRYFSFHIVKCFELSEKIFFMFIVHSYHDLQGVLFEQLQR